MTTTMSPNLFPSSRQWLVVLLSISLLCFPGVLGARERGVRRRTSEYDSDDLHNVNTRQYPMTLREGNNNSNNNHDKRQTLTSKKTAAKISRKPSMVRAPPSKRTATERRNLQFNSRQGSFEPWSVESRGKAKDEYDFETPGPVAAEEKKESEESESGDELEDLVISNAEGDEGELEEGLFGNATNITVSTNVTVLTNVTDEDNFEFGGATQDDFPNAPTVTPITEEPTPEPSEATEPPKEKGDKNKDDEEEPTAEPSIEPTGAPTVSPTDVPTVAITDEPTEPPKGKDAVVEAAEEELESVSVEEEPESVEEKDKKCKKNEDCEEDLVLPAEAAPPAAAPEVEPEMEPAPDQAKEDKNKEEDEPEIDGEGGKDKQKDDVDLDAIDETPVLNITDFNITGSNMTNVTTEDGDFEVVADLDQDVGVDATASDPAPEQDTAVQAEEGTDDFFTEPVRDPNLQLDEPGECLELEDAYILMYQYQKNEQQCLNNPNSCLNGCCRLDEWVFCDEENAFSHLPCICNHNTAP